MSQAYVTISDTFGDVVSLAGPFPTSEDAVAWADKMSDLDEDFTFGAAYVALLPVDPKEFEEEL